MAYELTSGRASAIAKLDFSGKSHCQRLDMVAKIFGAKNHASLMASLAKQETSPRKKDAGNHLVKTIAVLRDDGDIAETGDDFLVVCIRKIFDDGVSSWHDDEVVGHVSRSKSGLLMRSGSGFNLEEGSRLTRSQVLKDKTFEPRSVNVYEDVFRVLFFVEDEIAFSADFDAGKRLCECLDIPDLQSVSLVKTLYPPVKNPFEQLEERFAILHENMEPLREAHAQLSRPLSDDTDKGSEPGDPSDP